MGLCLDSAQCAGCGLCLRACAYGAIRMKEKRPQIDAGRCVLCGMCVQSCPKKALFVERAPCPRRPADDHSGVWVFAERGEEMLPVALELAAQARLLADRRGCAVTALLPRGTQAECDALIAAGADRVFLCQSPFLRDRLDGPYAEWVCGLVRRHRPEILLFGATGFGRSLAPRVAARLRVGLTADCTGLDIDPERGLLLQTRPAFGGNLMATIVSPEHRPQMATVRPGVMPAPAPAGARTGEIVLTEGPKTAGAVEILEQAARARETGIGQAGIIVSAGRGIGGRKNLSLAAALAERLGGQVGVSRPLADMGWMDRRHQIGQTGTAVSPRLLIAFGISGAIQHLAGMGGAQTVIAVNLDPDAPIFQAADYKVVGDAAEVLQALLKAL